MASRTRFVPGSKLPPASSTRSKRARAMHRWRTHPIPISLSTWTRPDLPWGRRRKCDFLFFADPNVVMPIEIKDGAPNVARATRQLQAGAKAADRLAPRGLPINFRPALVCRPLRRQKGFELRQAVVCVSRAHRACRARRMREPVDRRVQEPVTVRLLVAASRPTLPVACSRLDDSETIRYSTSRYRRRRLRVGSSIPSCAQKSRPRSKPRVVSAPSASRTAPVSSWR